MNFRTQWALLFVAGASLITGCDREQVNGSGHRNDGAASNTRKEEGKDGPNAGERVPATLDEAVNLLLENLTAEERKAILDEGEAYATSAHFGSGMGMRNSWGLWGDSPLTRFFARLGIYHADDMSSIINQAFARRLRDEPIELDKLVQYFRDYWEKQDIVAPLDLNCPHCRREMVITYQADRVSKSHPEREYFLGTCPEGREFLFYHQDGWKDAKSIDPEWQRREF
jgi:hypothetical protein